MSTQGFSTPPDLLVREWDPEADRIDSRPFWGLPETIVAWGADPPFESVICPACQLTFWERGDVKRVAEAFVDHVCQPREAAT